MRTGYSGRPVGYFGQGGDRRCGAYDPLPSSRHAFDEFHEVPSGNSQSILAISAALLLCENGIVSFLCSFTADPPLACGKDERGVPLDSVASFWRAKAFSLVLLERASLLELVS